MVSSRGVRVIAIATRTLPRREKYGSEDEHELTFAGFLTFLDRPKEGAAEALANLARLGVSVKLITGDVKLIAEHAARLVGMKHERVLTEEQLDELRDEALWREAERTDLFVEVGPNQKEHIILALIVVTLLIPYLPLVSVVDLVPIPPTLVATLVVITVAYVAAAEVTKHWFYRANPRA